MEDNEFLDAVLPSEGPYCVCELTTRKREHVYVDTREAAQACAYLMSQAEKNAYFALASFNNKGSREAANAKAMRSLFIDIDCGEGKAYPNKRAAAEALHSFLETSQLAELGTPWVVDSGGGIHAYWPFTADVSIPEWRDLSERFKRLCAEQKLRIDMTVTADAARVLRVPGTTNWKYPKPVVLKTRGNTFEFEDLLRVVRSHVVTVPTLRTPDAELASLPGAPLKRSPDAVGIKIVENTAVRFKDIVVKTVKTNSGCGQLRHYLENAKDDGMEPLWRGLLSIAKVCEDGWSSAQKLSNLHPYDNDRLLRKWNEVKGPYPCTKFDSENPGICPSCPHWGKITNPLRLGAHLRVDESEKIIDVVQDATDPTSIPERYIRPKAPRGFSYGEKGGIYKNEITEDAEGNKAERPILILAYDMFVLDILRQSSIHSAQMVIERDGRYVMLSYPMRAAVSKDDTLKFLAENNIVAYGAGNDKRLFEYVRACVEDASTRKAPTVVPAQYGWQEDGSFVFSGSVHYPDGTSKRVPMPDLENLALNTRTAGTLDGWRKIVALLDKSNLQEIIAHMCIGFGSPLMCFSGLHGLTFHAGHTKSGTGKSLALNLCASIWGAPQQYRTGAKTSVVAMQQRAGNLNGLPFVVDELTGLAREHMAWFPEWTFTFSEGKGKERMEAGANKERLNSTKWYGLAFFTSNTFMLDIMTGAMEHSMEGEIRRFLEWNPGKPLSWGAGELDVIKTMDTHYGVAGEAYVKWLVANRETAQRIWKLVYEKIYKDFNATNDERFWIAGCASIIAGATLCGPQYADIYPFNAKAIQAVLYADVERGRQALRRATRRPEDVLNAYVRDFYGQFVVIQPAGMGVPTSLGKTIASFGDGREIDASLTRSRVLGRVEREVSPGWTDFFVEERMLKRHCASMSFGYNDFLEGISKLCSAETVTKNMTMGTRAPAMRVTAIRFRRRTEEMLPSELETAQDV